MNEYQVEYQSKKRKLDQSYTKEMKWRGLEKSRTGWTSEKAKELNGWREGRIWEGEIGRGKGEGLLKDGGCVLVKWEGVVLKGWWIYVLCSGQGVLEVGGGGNWWGKVGSGSVVGKESDCWSKGDENEREWVLGDRVWCYRKGDRDIFLNEGLMEDREWEGNAWNEIYEWLATRGWWSEVEAEDIGKPVKGKDNFFGRGTVQGKGTNWECVWGIT